LLHSTNQDPWILATSRLATLRTLRPWLAGY